MTVNEYSSPLADRFREFVNMKHALGYKYESSNIYWLKMLDELCSEYSEAYLSKKVIDAWAEQRAGESIRTQQKRVRFSNEIAEFLLQRGVSAHIVPMERKKCFPSPSMYTPYIFTHEQIRVFFQATDKHPPHRAHPISNHAYSVLFRLLYCCGLRLSEALNLKYNDLNLKSGVLTIRDGKFSKDRLVPMTQSLCELCSNYLPIVKAHLPDNPYIFPTRFSLAPINADNAYAYFRKVLWEAGIPHGGRGKGPRVHDFRHTFSVHSLQNWVENNVDVYAALPILATYLGHDDITMTEKYLRLTAEVYPEILRMTEAYSGAVVPEVRFYEND